MQASADEPQCHPACFTIVPSGIFRIGRPAPIEVFRPGKVDAVLGDIGLPFEFVPFVCHGLIVHTIIAGIKTDGAPRDLPEERLTVSLQILVDREHPF